jgi:hypothetical protein
MQNGNIVLTDGAATPVNHTFTPNPVAVDKTAWTKRSGGILIGNEKLTVKVHEAEGNEQYSVVSIRLYRPVLETISGENSGGLVAQPTLAYVNYAELTYRFHKRSTEQMRKDLRLMLVDANTTDIIVACIDQLELPFG